MKCSINYKEKAMNKDILLVAHFCSSFGATSNNRFSNLAEKLSELDTSVELVTSDFLHQKKEKRVVSSELSRLKYKVTLINEPAYKKNVSIKRFYSHYKMARNLKKYLKTRKVPDLIYCAVPSLDIALVAARYAKKNRVKFIIDIQDLWPEAFKMILNIPILFYPMKKIADYIYKTADEIIAVSETYKDRALRVNNKPIEGKTVYLGIDLKRFDTYFNQHQFHNKPSNEIWLCYVGTLGHSYDLTTVIDALEIIMCDKGIDNIRFIVMGDGPLKSKFEDYSKSKQISILFTGRLPYDEMVGILGVCDIAVNPITRGAAGSIINKHADYAAAGLPVLNTQESLEYRNLVNSYNMGLNCNNNDPKDLAEKLIILFENPEMRIEMGKNSRRLAEDKFDRRNSYKVINDLIEKYTMINFK